MKTPLFSVIIPTFNRAHIFVRALNSILSQKDCDFEVLVIDDGSTDKTKEIMNSMINDQIKYFYQENAGVSTARNKGAKLATGKYLVFLDTDDEFLPNGLKRFKERLIQSEGSVICFAGYQLNYENDQFVRKPKKQSLNRLFKGISVTNIAGSFCFEREYFLKIGGYTEGATHSENWELMIRATHCLPDRNDPISYTNESVVKINVTKNYDKYMVNKQKKIQSHSIFYQVYKNNGLAHLRPYFAHVVAKNYALLGDLSNTLHWTIRSIKPDFRFWYLLKPLGIYIKRRFVAVQRF